MALPLQQLSALLLEQNLFLVPVLGHHLVELVHREICDLLLRDAGEWSTDAFIEVDGAAILDRNGLRDPRGHAPLERRGIVGIASIVPEERVDADVLRLVSARAVLDHLQAPILIRGED